MLSRRRETITGNKVAKKLPSIKPVKARRIIRRFHLLINKRRIVCGKLGIPIVDNDEVRNKEVISAANTTDALRKAYEAGWQMDHPNSKMEAALLQVQTMEERQELVKILGYVMGEMHARGGLQNYQLASTIGQDGKRGGDSSKMLVSWFREMFQKGEIDNKRKFSALEIGCLSAKNHISTSGIFNPVVRIDLNSNDAMCIERQNFMERPLPTGDGGRFDLISCSLVLNFVPSPAERGRMILRFQEFLRRDIPSTYLFVVLPLPCMNNSRYMDTGYFCDMMSCLGYRKLRYREAKKLVYFLFEHETPVSLTDVSKERVQQQEQQQRFQKRAKLHDKPGMNNFSIVL